MTVKCNKCSYIGDENEFQKGRDFFQHQFISGCPKCDNFQSPGNSSMRGFGGERPFVYLREKNPDNSPLETTLHRISEAS